MKILLVRTDRIGEFLLTTPAIRAVRQAFPEAEITLIVGKNSYEIIEGSSLVNSIIKFEPTLSEGHLLDQLKFFKTIKGLRFDMAIIFNPSKFFNIISFLAGIPVRVGYDRKLGFLLTHRIEDKKYLCEKHEVEYNLELTAAAGVPAGDKRPDFPLTDSAEKKVEALLASNATGANRTIIAVHPSVSNPDKMWPAERFAIICDRLAADFNAKIILIGAADERRIAEEVKAKMDKDVLDLTGALGLKELGAFLKRCAILISNDSGPVHIAAALGVPTVVFFGESRPGGSSKRWGPYGEGHVIISAPRVFDITVDEAYGKIRERLSEICQRT